MLPVPPWDSNEALVGTIEYVHDVVADCVTVKVCPATVIVPVRLLPVVLAATV